LQHFFHNNIELNNYCSEAVIASLQETTQNIITDNNLLLDVSQIFKQLEKNICSFWNPSCINYRVHTNRAWFHWLNLWQNTENVP